MNERYAISYYTSQQYKKYKNSYNFVEETANNMHYALKQSTISELILVGLIQWIVKVCKIRRTQKKHFYLAGNGLICNILGLWRFSADEKYIYVKKNSKANYTESI